MHLRAATIISQIPYREINQTLVSDADQGIFYEGEIVILVVICYNRAILKLTYAITDKILKRS